MRARAYRGGGEALRGEMTAFLALIFILLISFAGSLLESASIQSAKNYRRADVNRALESVFAEYQRELLEEYDLFALDGSYESGYWGEEKVTGRLAFYGAGSMEHDITRLEILTDEGGSPFLVQVEDWVRHRYGLDKLEGLLGNAQIWGGQEQAAEDYRKKEQAGEDHLASLLEEQEQQLPEEGNPLDHVEGLRKSPLLSLVMPRDRQVSDKQTDLSGQPSRRSLVSGYGSFDDVAEQGEASRLALGVYLLDHFSCAVPEGDGSGEEEVGALAYELEYILAGKASDRENLEAVVQKILLIRLAANFAYIQTDSVSKAEASAMAGTLCALLAVPAVIQAVTQAILFAWSFGESIVDIRALLGGRKVPLVKDSESWQLTLSSLLKLGDGEEWNEGKDTTGGMAYRDYIQMLLFLTGTGEAAMRSLDLIEMDLRTEKGLDWFRADHCITKLELDSRCSLRRGISYRFSTYFGYN